METGQGVIAMLLVQMAVRLLPPDLHAALKAQVKRRFGVARA